MLNFSAVSMKSSHLRRFALSEETVPNETVRCPHCAEYVRGMGPKIEDDIDDQRDLISL